MRYLESKMKNLTESFMRKLCHVNYLKVCLETNVMPRSLNLCYKVNGQIWESDKNALYVTLMESSVKLIQHEIKKHEQGCLTLESQILKRKEELIKIKGIQDIRAFTEYIKKFAKDVNLKETDKKKQKT